MERVGRSLFGRRAQPPPRRSAVPTARSRHDLALASRADAVAWASAIAADPTVVYLDTETTGLGPDAEVIDVAVIAADGAVHLDTLVRPAARIPADASAIHGIVDADVALAPTWPEVHDRLSALLADRIVVVYNASFDKRLIAQCCDRHRLSLPVAAWECAMRRFAAFHGESAARGGFRLHRLDRAVAVFGGAPPGHRAAADACACRAVVLGMASFPVDQPDHAAAHDLSPDPPLPHPLHQSRS